VADPLTGSMGSISASPGVCPSCGVPAVSTGPPPGANLALFGAGAGGRSGAAAAVGRPTAGSAVRVSGAPPAGVGAAVRRATPLAVAGALSGLANLGVTLIVARELSNRDYGAFAQLFAIFFVLSMPGSAVLVGVVRGVTAMRRDGLDDRAWTTRLERASQLFVVGAGLAAFGCGDRIARALGLPDAAGVGAIVTAGAAWIPLSVDRGRLQCDRRYRALAGNLAIEAAARCGATLPLVAAGGGPAAAAWAALGGVLTAVVHARWLLARAATRRPVASPASSGPASSGPASSGPASSGPARTRARGGRRPPAGLGRPRRRMAGDVVCALVALALLGVLQNMDVIVVGRVAPDRVGSYAAASVACKVLVFAAAVLGGFLLPEAARARARGRHALHQLGGTLLIIAVPAGVLGVLAACAPRRLLLVAFGPGLTGCAGALAPLAAAMTALASSVLFTHYLLAVGRRAVVLALAAAAGLGVVLLERTDGGAGTARADLVVQICLAALTGGMVLASARRRSRAGRGPRDQAWERLPPAVKGVR